MRYLTNTRLQSLFLFGFAFLLYVNTLGHGFAQDDIVVLTQNRLVQKGFAGIPQLFSDNSLAGFLPEGAPADLLAGGRYRPLSLAVFAVLNQFFGNSALVFHLFAVLLYALNGLLLYHTLRLALEPFREKLPVDLITWGATLLFVVHPVHTEVVANIKGCDEQLALLAGLGVLYALLRAVDTSRRSWLAGAGILFLVAGLAKETALALFVVAPAALWVFRDFGKNRAAFLKTGLPLLAALVVYVLFRGFALDWQFAAPTAHDPLNNPFLKSDKDQWVPFTATERWATIFYTQFEYLRLLVWPQPLTHDYYPFQIEAQRFSASAVWAGIVWLALLLALIGRSFIKKNVAAFGLLLYLLPLLLVANVFFPVGTFMAERFLFMPSAGFCFALVIGIAWLTGRFRLPDWVPVAAIAVPAVVFAVLTVLRNPAWKSDKMLLETDLATSPRSAKLNNSLGTLLLTEALQTTDTIRRNPLLRKAGQHLRQAIELHPTYYDALLAYGATTFYLGNYIQSINAYAGAGRINPNDSKPKVGLFYALRYGGEYDLGAGNAPERGIEILQKAWELQADTAVARLLAAQAAQSKKYAEAVEWWEKAVALAPGDNRLLQALSEAYRAAGQPDKAKAVLESKQSFQLQTPAETNR